MELESSSKRFPDVDVQTKHQNRHDFDVFIRGGFSNENRVRYESCGKFNIKIEYDFDVRVSDGLSI